MSCKKGGTYELFFKYIHKSRLLKKWGGNYIYMKQISSWQVFNFLLYRQSSILQDILFYIWYLTICFWIDWVHVYKYTKIKGLDSSTREITSLPKSKKVMNMACHFSHCWKWNVQGKFTTPDQVASPSAPLIEVLLIKILLLLDHLFQSNHHF